jgi:hypothetical protein
MVVKPDARLKENRSLRVTRRLFANVIGDSLLSECGD